MSFELAIEQITYLLTSEYKLSASRTAACKLFHTTGPATEKALSPSFVLVRGTEQFVL